MTNIKNVLVLCLSTLAVSCVSEEEIDEIDDRIIEVDEDELPPGVRRSTVDGVTTWEISGAEGHRWMREYLQDRIVVEPNEDAIEAYQGLVDDIDHNLPIMGDEDELQFRGKTLTASIEDTPTNGHPGLKAYANAERSGVGSVCVDTRSKVDTNDTNPGQHCKWGVGRSTSQTAHTSHPLPNSNCYAFAKAWAGGQSTFAETFNCPVNTGGGSGDGDGGGGGGGGGGGWGEDGIPNAL